MTPTAGPPEPTDAAPIAYVLSRFPKTTETFIFREIEQVEASGIPVEVYAFVRERGTVMQPEAARLADRVVIGADDRRRLLAAQWYWMRRAPIAYLGLWAAAVAGNWRSPRFLLRAVAVVPLAARLARHTRSTGCRHIHAHYASHTALAAMFASRLTGVPFSFTAHAHDIFVDRSMLDRKLDAAAFVIAISHHNRDLIGELYGPDAARKTEVIRCGVDVDVFDPDRVTGATRTSDFELVSVGSLEPYKGHDVLLRAVERLREDGIDVHLTIVGEGPERDRLAEAISSHREPRAVTLAGATDRDRVRSILAGADCFVLASVVTPEGKMDGIPVALMEAMAMRLPVVASDVSGIPELVEHEVNGLLVPPGDPVALAEALATIGRNRRWAEDLGREGRAHVCRSFDLSAEAGRLIELLTVGTVTPAAAPPEAAPVEVAS